MKNKQFIVVSCLSLLLTCLPVYAGDYRFAHFTLQDGLPHMQVNALMQDANGQMWMGTRNGLCCYNGYEWRVFQHDSTPNSLCHNYVRTLYVDPKERIWIGTHDNCCRYIGKGQFKTYEVHEGIREFTSLDKGELFMATYSKLYQYNEKSDEFVHLDVPVEVSISGLTSRGEWLYYTTGKHLYRYSCSTATASAIMVLPQGVSGDNISPLFFDGHGYLWIGLHGHGVMRLDIMSGKTINYDASMLSDGIVRCISEDAEGVIWLGTEKGITLLDGRQEQIQILSHSFYSSSSLSHNAVYSILRDKDDNMWVSTFAGGVDVQWNNTRKFQHIEPGIGQQNIPGKVISVMQQVGDDIWIGTGDGGLHIYNRTTRIVSRFDKLPAEVHNIHALYYDAKHHKMWIGTFMTGLYLYDITLHTIRRIRNLPSEAIFSITGHDDVVYIGTTQGLRQYDYKTQGLSTMPVQSGMIPSPLDYVHIYTCLLDHERNLWLGTTSGLYRYHLDSLSLTYWGKPDLQDDYITCLGEDHQHRVWVGTNNGGLCQTPISGTIAGILESNDDALWVSTTSGIHRYQPSDGSDLLLCMSNGLPTNQFEFSSCLKDDKGLLYFGSVNGVVIINPAINYWDQQPLHVYFDTPASAKISHRQAEQLAIPYWAINLQNARDIHYQIRLLGRDHDWQESSDHKFIGNNLPAGRYTLQVRASMTNQWDKAPIAEYTFRILPPWYKSVWFIAIIVAILTAVGYMVLRFVKDHLRQKHQLQMEEQEKIHAHELVQLKNEFFTSIAHELKTPLSLIIAPLQKMASEQRSSTTDIALRNAQRMSLLVDQLTTYTLADSGNLQLLLNYDNPMVFIEHFVELYQPAFRQKQLQLQLSIEDNGELVWFSADFLEKILNNLLSNAIKFTPEQGMISLHAYIEEGVNHYRFLHVQIADNGIGIRQDELNHIFDRYYQSRHDVRSKHLGWGIGLSLTRQLVELHQGTITVQSKVGEGSTFDVTLCVSHHAYRAEQYTAQPVNEETLPHQINRDLSAISDTMDLSPDTVKEPVYKGKLLIVDDNHDLANFLSTIFSAKYQVYTAHNGKEALAIARTQLPELIISDVMMPQMDGMEFCKQIKQDELTEHILIILLTAKTDVQSQNEAFESGADVFLVKPFNVEALELQVENLLKLRSQQLEEVKKGIFSLTDMHVELSERDKTFLENLEQLVEKNIGNEEFAVTDITHALGMSRSVLHSKMKSLCDMSVMEYVHLKRIEFAKQLLQKGYTVNEVTFQTGFSDPSYFTKSFRRQTGISPSEYKKSLTQ